MPNYLFEGWFSLLSGFAIFVMGLRVYWLDSSRRMYQVFMLSTFFLFVQNMFFFQMDASTDLEYVRELRPWQENIWNLAILFIILTMWHYAQQFSPREMKPWERAWFWLSLVLGGIMLILQGFTPYGHGELVTNEAGRWAVELSVYQGNDLFRVMAVFIMYSFSIYLSYLPFHYARNAQTKNIRLAVVVIYCVVIVGSFVSNYVLTYFLQEPATLNETANVAVGALFSGLMIINLQLTDLQSEYAVPNLLKTMTNWFMLTDEDFRIKQVNAAFLKSMGGTAKLWQDVPITEVLSPEHWNRYKPVIKRLAINTTESYETRVQTTRDLAYLLFVVTPLYKRLWVGGRRNRAGYVFVGTDLTQYKASQERIQAYANDLEVSNQALERFAYIASHDLKEPIRNIGNFAQLLRRHLAKGSEAELSEYLGFIEDSVDGMNQLVEAVMAISRLGQEALDLQEVDVQAMLQDVQERLEKRIAETDARLIYKGLPTVTADLQLLRQLFQNLIDNALKYNQSSDPVVEISAEYVEQTRSFRFRIIDNGIGIEPNYREQIFEMFKRLHSRSSYPGTGIGLAICRRIVELHGGQIWVEDRKEQTGSVFVVELPDNS
ncbi:MAG: ATP-binding protein [Bacteroidota bacterium]